MAEEISRRRLWLIVLAGCLAGSTQLYRIVVGEGGTPAVASTVCWAVVVVTSGWQLHRSR